MMVFFIKTSDPESDTGLEGWQVTGAAGPDAGRRGRAES